MLALISLALKAGDISVRGVRIVSGASISTGHARESDTRYAGQHTLHIGNYRAAKGLHLARRA